jgi:hypothetical protein
LATNNPGAPAAVHIPTPDEIRAMHEESVRIMSILMPYALRQMEEAYQSAPGQTHARFVHYSSAEAALKIIQTKRFWMRNTNCMADYRENDSCRSQRKKSKGLNACEGRERVAVTIAAINGRPFSW